MSGESAAELKAWTDGLGADADKAAAKMQARHRGKVARHEVDAKKKYREEHGSELLLHVI